MDGRKEQVRHRGEKGRERLQGKGGLTLGDGFLM